MKIAVCAAAVAACGNVHRQPVPAPGDAAASREPGPADAGPLPAPEDAAPVPIAADAGAEGPAASSSDGPPRLSGAWHPCGQLGQGGPEAVALSDDGSLAFVAGALGNVVDVYEVKTHKLVTHLPAPAGRRVVGLVPSHDGRLVAVLARLLPLAPETLMSVVRVSDGKDLFDSVQVYGAPSFSPDGERILLTAGGYPGQSSTAQLHRLMNPVLLRDYGPATAVAFGPTGDVLVYDGNAPSDGTLSVFHADAAPAVRPAPHGPSALFSPRATYLASSAADTAGQTRWDLHRVSDDEALASLFGPVLRFSPDDQVVVTYGNTSGGMFDPVTGRGLTLPPGLGVSEPLQDLALGPGGRTALAASIEGLLEAGVPDAPDGILWNVGLGTGSPVVSIAASANGRWLATGSNAGRRAVLLWDLANGRQQTSLFALGPVTGLTFAGDSARLAHTAGADAVEWGLELDAPIWTAERTVAGVFQGQTWMAAYPPDWSHTAVAGFDAPVALVERGSTAAPLEIVTGERQIGVAFTPDGRFLATSEPGLYRVDDGSRVWSHPQPFPTQKDLDYSENWVSISPDGTVMVVSRFRMWQSVPWLPPGPDSSSYLADTRIYRTADGALVKDLGHLPRRPVFSPDGAWLSAGLGVMEWASGRSLDLNAGFDTKLGVDPGSGAVSTFLPDGTLAAGNAYGVVYLFCP